MPGKMSCLSMPFGASFLSPAVDAETIVPPQAPVIADEVEAIGRALDSPTGCERLAGIVRPGENVVIVVNDITRLVRSDVFLPPIVDSLNRAGIPDADISIVFALGTHRKQTEAEKRSIVGEEIFRRIRLYDHDGSDDANLVEVGTTSLGNQVEINRRVVDADRIILTGEILFHQIAGYSGGRKAILPGVAGNRTTTFNHRMVLDPRCGPGRLDGNPAHEDMLQGCRMVDPDFLVNVILNPAGGLLCVVAGHYELAHLKGCGAADRLLRTGIPCLYDLVIASAGGAPLDIDLRQAHKGMENACAALRPGGTLYYYAECGEGPGSSALEHYLKSFGSEEEMERALRRDFVVGGHKALWLARLGRRYDIHLVTRLDPALVARCGFRAVAPEAHETQLMELKQLMPSARAAAMPHAGFTVPVLGQAGARSDNTESSPSHARTSGDSRRRQNEDR